MPFWTTLLHLPAQRDESAFFLSGFQNLQGSSVVCSPTCLGQMPSHKSMMVSRGREDIERPSLGLCPPQRSDRRIRLTLWSEYRVSFIKGQLDVGITLRNTPKSQITTLLFRSSDEQCLLSPRVAANCNSQEYVILSGNHNNVEIVLFAPA